MSDLEDLLRKAAELVNAQLNDLIPSTGKGPHSLRDAMRWSLFAGGKRFRPAMVLATGRIFGADDLALVRCGAAIEMIHTYSLIHDDLPSMDDDDLRRGKETCHKRFGEATAILAGDALQALAFQTIAETPGITDDVRIRLISGLGQAAACMVVGQQMDLEAEGRSIDLEHLDRIHENKTGALITFSLRAGALAAGASENDLAAITKFGNCIGLLFQIVDDLLDVTSTTETLGKTAGKDAAASKSTYPSLIGIDATRARVAMIEKDAIAELSTLSMAPGNLALVPRFMAERTS